MSADAASLPCPICSHTGVFDSVQTLRDRLIAVSTNKILCPVCQEEVSGLDKLTIHLFSHVKLITTKGSSEGSEIQDIKCKPKSENTMIKSQQKKPRTSTAKNKTQSTPNTPVKFVKIYPKLPVISLNTVPVIDISHGNAVEECVQASNSFYVPTVKTEASLLQTNTTCNVCGLQFVDVNILRMHRCLIHNIDENANQSFTRYNCHLCPKHFKMRGSLMVHLRVAHYGFFNGNVGSDSNTEKNSEGTNLSQLADDKPVNLEKSDNKQWQCDVCRKCFTTKYFLKKHKRLHTGETPYACTQCNKTFTFQQSYHKHLLYHNDEKPHTCGHCGRAFKELSTLHNHQRIHTGEKPFSCETCGKCFRQRVSYLVHRRIHTGVMPYKCTACQKSFRYKVSQRTHKCQSQPPGTVVRQTGDLVEKLKKKQADSVSTSLGSVENLHSKAETEAVITNPESNSKYPEVSEANAELVRAGAKLSLEDMESESFSFIAEIFNEKNNDQPSTSLSPEVENSAKHIELIGSSIDELIDSIPVVDKSIPSPSEIFKNLRLEGLSKEDDFIGVFQETDHENNFRVHKDFNVFL